MNIHVSEILGWMGVVCILVAFGLNTQKILTSDCVVYLFLNAFGAIGIIVDAAMQKNYQPVVLNIVWLFIASLGLVEHFL